jgi:uncharacterized protein YbjT (DUF2867 family)
MVADLSTFVFIKQTTMSMNIIITGSLGHVSKPLTQELVQKGHAVTVISSSTDRQQAIEELGAKAAIGSLEDADFLAVTFAGADAVYVMIPPNNYFDPTLDLLAYYRQIAANYARAIEQAGVKRVVHLSSIGAHMTQNSGLILGHHEVEEILKKVPNISLTRLRPTSFYYNLYGYMDSIRNQGIIANNENPDLMQSWVSPRDIAAVAAEELTMPSKGGNVRYVASDERTGTDIARIIGEAIGKPNLTWVMISDDQLLSGLKAAGMNSTIADGFVEMYAKVRTGEMMADYEQHKPAAFGKVKLTDFARDFAAAYNHQ